MINTSNYPRQQRPEFTREQSDELTKLTNSLASALYADMPEDLARLRVERILRFEFEARELSRGTELFAAKTYTSKVLSDAAMMSKHGADKRYLSGERRAAILANDKRAKDLARKNAAAGRAVISALEAVNGVSHE